MKGERIFENTAKIMFTNNKKRYDLILLVVYHARMLTACMHYVVDSIELSPFVYFVTL